ICRSDHERMRVDCRRRPAQPLEPSRSDAISGPQVTQMTCRWVTHGNPFDTYANRYDHRLSMASRDGTNPFRWNRRRSKCDQRFPKPNNRQLDAGNSVYRISLVSGKVLCGGQQTLSIQCRGGNLSGKRFELRAAENWAGALLPRFSTMRDAHRPVRFLRVDRPSASPGVSEMRGPLRRSSSAEEAFLLGSVLGDGLRATDLPREPA